MSFNPAAVQSVFVHIFTDILLILTYVSADQSRQSEAVTAFILTAVQNVLEEMLNLGPASREGTKLFAHIHKAHFCHGVSCTSGSKSNIFQEPNLAGHKAASGSEYMSALPYVSTARILTGAISAIGFLPFHG